MSDNKTITLTPDDGVTIPRLRLGETGYTGLKVSQGLIKEQRRKDLKFPKSIETFKSMSEDATISAAISLMEMMLQKVEWNIHISDEASEKDKKIAKFLESCMTDMEHSWSEFISEVTSTYTYGFCLNEKVFRRRLKITGSKYNDGLVGIKKLPVRSQDSIKKWKFSPDGRYLEGVVQTIDTDSGQYPTLLGTEVEIPRQKFLLFRTDVKKGNPEGTSPLNGIYNAWKYRTTLEETEAIGLARGLGGLPVKY